MSTDATTYQIIHGDCLEVMRGMEAESVDIVITDPPYGLGDKMNGGTWGANVIYLDMRTWDKVASNEHINEIFRISKNQIIWGGNFYMLPPSRCWLSWNKPQLNTMSDFELASTSFDKPSKSFSCIRNPDGRKEHPTQKPISLMKWCIENFTQEGDTFLDPFCGSGSTGVAALQMGRNFIGIELNPDYVELSRRRVGQAMPLFTEAQP